MHSRYLLELHKPTRYVSPAKQDVYGKGVLMSHSGLPRRHVTSGLPKRHAQRRSYVKPYG
jgi:hypothetical protein